MFNVNVKNLFRRVSEVVVAATALYKTGRELFLEIRKNYEEVRSAWKGFRTA